MRPETLSDIVGSVYDCVLESHEWSRTLPLISDFGESAASSIVVQDRLSSSGTSIFEHAPINHTFGSTLKSLSRHGCLQ
jgi:hypothetical protein